MKERDKKGKGRGNGEASRGMTSFLTTVGSAGWEKLPSDRASIPTLQTQSAESRTTFAEMKATTSQLRAHLHSLRVYRLSLMKTHSSFQSLLLAYEGETIALKASSSPDRPRKADELTALLTSYGRKVADMRKKQRREVELYKRSKEDQVEGWAQGNRELRLRVRRYEDTLAKIDGEDILTDEKYTEQLAIVEKQKASIEDELRHLREARTTDQIRLLSLQRLSLTGPPPVAPLPLRRQKSEGSHQTAKELLTTLKKRLSAASSGSLKPLLLHPHCN